MKIESLEIANFPPIKHLKLENLGQTIIIAGANGAGKTRLKEAIVATLKGSPAINMTLLATRPEEEDQKYFGGKSLKLVAGTPNTVLNNYISSRNYSSSAYVGSLVQIDSNRNVQSLKYTAVNWLGGDPDDGESTADYYFNAFSSRWSDFMNYIHQKSAARDKKLADELKQNPNHNGETILKKYPDPLEKYKRIFEDLLPGKVLQDVNPAKPKEFSYKGENGNILPFSSLSSGEQEVVKVVFDIVRKDIRHSIIIVDEPELHLHPTLAFKLVEALKSIGNHTNQFIFLTHSADLISTYYSTGDVYFIDAVQTGSNQAHKLSELGRTHSHVVQLIGQNLGLFAVGKKLVFVEGENSSVDRLTYHAIAQKFLSDAKVIPVGSVANLSVLNSLEEQIRNSIFGVEIFMIRDRDGLTDAQVSGLEKGGKIRCLKRRHVENYFLDAEVLFEVAQLLYLTTSNSSLSAADIERRISEIAASTLTYNLVQNTKVHLSTNHFLKIPNIKGLESKNCEAIKEELVEGVKQSVGLIVNSLNEEAFRAWMDAEEKRIADLLTDGKWKNEFHGKIIFSKLCSEVLKETPIRVRQAYVDTVLRNKHRTFSDIEAILSSFN